MTSNDQFTSWPIFLQALQTRFALSQYKDPTGSLFKLTQKGSVEQYLSEFEELVNHVVGLPPSFLLSCFVSGLSPDIRREVQAHQPLTLAQASALARLQEDCPPPPRQRPSPAPTLGPPRHTLLPSLLASPPRPLPSQPNPPTPTFKRGLYFNCDERYHRGHRCALRVFLLIAEDKDSSDPALPLINPTDPNPDSTLAPDPYLTQISLNSLAGHLAPEMLRLVGVTSGQAVLLLVDGGSTHNFIQQHLVN